MGDLRRLPQAGLFRAVGPWSGEGWDFAALRWARMERGIRHCLEEDNFARSTALRAALCCTPACGGVEACLGCGDG